MFALILTFLTLTGNPADPYRVGTSKALLFPSKDACVAAIPAIQGYWQGVHASDGVYVNAFCNDVIVNKATGS